MNMFLSTMCLVDLFSSLVFQRQICRKSATITTGFSLFAQKTQKKFLGISF